MATLCTSLRKVSSSNLRRGTGYPDPVISSLDAPHNGKGLHFFPNVFQTNKLPAAIRQLPPHTDEVAKSQNKRKDMVHPFYNEGILSDILYCQSQAFISDTSLAQQLQS
jgi:hypothetical protein